MSTNIPSNGLLCTHRKQDQSNKIGDIGGFFALGRGPVPKANIKSKDSE